jgi:diguanylate cyclase (GGDEF)-like protein
MDEFLEGRPPDGARQELRLTRSLLGMQIDAARLLAAATNIDVVIAALLEVVCSRGDWDAALLWSLDPISGTLRPRGVWRGADGSGTEPLPDDLPVERELAQRSCEQRSVMWTAGDARSSAPIRGARSIVVVPIISGGRSHGAIELFSHLDGSPSALIENSLLGVAAQLGQFLERRQVEMILSHQSLHDELTGVPNRILFGDRIRQSIVAAGREAEPLAVLILDLDRFKEINDTFGHPVGDELLRQVAGRLGTLLRDSDTFARLGGDEFGILLPGADAAGAEVVAAKLRTVLSERYDVHGLDLESDASIGIALFPDHGETVELLVQRADIAMYGAKGAGSGFALYVPEDDPHSRERHALVGQLRRAVEDDNLVLHFQPIVNPRNGRLTGVEALVRWEHPARGTILPGEFIGLAEHTGLIRPITVWVLEEALRQGAAWRAQGLDVRVEINLSARNLQDFSIADTLAQALARIEGDPGWLGVEITETTVMHNLDRARDVLQRLHDMGLRISIDDFGTGYSSFAYLRDLPIDEVKIDRTFVRDMARSGSDRAIVRATIDLVHELGLTVVAEGVEDVETWEMLVTMGCDRVQGYYVARPLPAATFEEWLSSSEWDA